MGKDNEKDITPISLSDLLHSLNIGPVIVDGRNMGIYELNREIIINGKDRFKQVGGLSHGGLPVRVFESVSESSTIADDKE